MHGLVQGVGTVPGAGRFEGLADHAHPRESVAQVGHAQERGAPRAGRGVIGGATGGATGRGRGPRRRTTVVLRQGDQFGEPVGDGEVRGLHPEDEYAPAAPGHARERGLARIEQPAVGRVQARLRDGADRVGRGLEVVEQDRGGRLVAGPVLQPHPCLGDHAERALRSQEQPVGDGPAPEPGTRSDSLTPTGVITRMDSVRSSMWVRSVA